MAEVNADHYEDTVKKSPSDQFHLRPDQLEHLPDSEAGDPNADSIDHDERRSTRLVNTSFDATELKKPLIECGCGECSSSVDPLADESHSFRDVNSAKRACPEPRAMTVKRASKAYVVYQKASLNAPDRTSELERTKNIHGRLIGGDIVVRDRMQNPTLIFLSLRVSPIQRNNGNRRWTHPLTLDSRIAEGWENAYATLRYQLEGFEYEFAWVTATTSSAQTPHRHTVIYVDDPDDDVTIDMARSVVHSFVNNTQGAEHSFHPVEADQSDAGMIFHEIPTAEKGMQSHPPDANDVWFAAPSVPMYYVANQMEHWKLKNIFRFDSDIDADSYAVGGAAIAWASQNNWVGSSNGFPM